MSIEDDKKAVAETEAEAPEGKEPSELDELENADRGDELEDETDGGEPEGGEPAAEGDEPAAADDGPKTIPYARFKQTLDRMKAAESRLHELESSKSAEAAATHKQQTAERKELLDDLYEQVEDARASGDTFLAAELQRRIDDVHRDDAKREAYNAAVRAQQDTLYDTMVATLEQSYPFLNPRSDDYEDAVVKELEEMVRGYEAQGYSGPNALRKAARYMFAEDPFSGRRAEPPAPSGKRTDVKRNVAAAKRQPPSVGASGKSLDNTKTNILGLDEEEFAALPESKLAAARGDFL